MRALDRLRAVEKFQTGEECEPTKPPKPGFVSFVSTDPPTVTNFTPATDPTPEQSAELRELVPEVCRLYGEADVAAALVAALADPDAALTCYRALEADFERVAVKAESTPGDDRMQTCRQCANLAPSGRCLAAFRGEAFGVGIATARNYTPGMPDRPQRCGAYVPGPSDHDRRPGRERWSFLFQPPLTAAEAWGNPDRSTTAGLFKGG